MEKKEFLYEGKAKKIYATDDPDKVIVYYKDDATAFNGERYMFPCHLFDTLVLLCLRIKVLIFPNRY